MQIINDHVRLSHLHPWFAPLQPQWMAVIEWHLGDVVRALRERKHWTQQQLAKRAGMNKATIVSVEQMDRNHGRETYAKIAAAFDLSMGELFSLVPAGGTQNAVPSGQTFQPWDGTTERRTGTDRRLASAQDK